MENTPAYFEKMEEAGKDQVYCITHYTDSMHDELAKMIKSEPIDFVQFNYPIDNRNAEKQLLSLAAKLGVATLINRPFGEGRLFNKIRGRNLPAWSKEYGIETWSQFFLKFIISHPAVSCVIPATSNPVHAADNWKARLELC